MKLLGLVGVTVVMLAGCRIENSLPRDSCHTTADCVGVNTCVEGVCVGPIDAGSSRCETFPPETCARPEGPLHLVDISELQRLLPGRWLLCNSDVEGGVAAQPGVVGIEFNTDATLWWLLDDDGHGVPVQHTGSIGTVEFSADPYSVSVALDFFGSSAGQLNPAWQMNAAFTDGPPMRMRIMNGGSPTYYVLDDSGCAEHPDLGADSVDLSTPPVFDLASSGSIGGPCNPAVVLPTSCPAINNVACSLCGQPTMPASAPPSMFQCLQPCHMNASECVAPQTCVSLALYTRAGDCVGFDGVCM